MYLWQQVVSLSGARAVSCRGVESLEQGFQSLIHNKEAERLVELVRHGMAIGAIPIGRIMEHLLGVVDMENNQENGMGVGLPINIVAQISCHIPRMK